jgi:glycosyltransferase involved in cell wall biosynthesis
MRLGVVANEFFDPARGRVGGFGWAARRVARLFADDPSLGVEVVLLSGERVAEGDLDGVPLIAPRRNRIDFARRVRGARLDLLLTIDHRPQYLPALLARPRTPLAVWVRDPRPPAAAQAGIDGIDCTSLAHVVCAGRLLRRRVLWASPAPATLQPRTAGVYGVDVPPLRFLPNPVDEDVPAVERPASRPRVVFLGRLDPVKRPWLFVELARRVPEAEFLVLGQQHVSGWQPNGLPANVRLLGHVEGEEKRLLLASAAALVNTSQHEGLPVSFLESLACGTPIVSSHDPEGTVSRFGVLVEHRNGDGLDAVAAFEDGLRRLLADEGERDRLGALGRDWVAATHTRSTFLAAFDELCRDAGALR